MRLLNVILKFLNNLFYKIWPNKCILYINGPETLPEPLKAEEEADAYFKRVETKLDQLLKIHGCDVCEDSIIRPTHNVDEKLTEISDKLAVLLCGPLDEETLKELQAEREANKK